MFSFLFFSVIVILSYYSLSEKFNYLFYKYDALLVSRYIIFSWWFLATGKPARRGFISEKLFMTISTSVLLFIVFLLLVYPFLWIMILTQTVIYVIMLDLSIVVTYDLYFSVSSLKTYTYCSFSCWCVPSMDCKHPFPGDIWLPVVGVYRDGRNVFFTNLSTETFSHFMI